MIEDITDMYSKMIGVDRSSLLEHPYFEIFNDADMNEQLGANTMARAFRSVFVLKKPQTQHIFRRDIPDPNQPGETLESYWRTILYPMYGVDGDVTHILQVFSNATKEVMAARELEEARLHVEEALEAGNVGSWTWDVDSDVVIGNNGMAEIFGFPSEKVQQGVPLDVLVQNIHKDDRDRVVRALQQALYENEVFDTEFRIGYGDKTCWAICRGRPLIHQGVQRLSGVMVDITERRDLQAQIDLARRQDRLSRAEALLLKHKNDELEMINKTKEEFVALASHQLRTPATAVKQYLGMVIQGYVGPISDKQAETLAKAFESNERQIQIINQILNAARVATGKLVITKTPVDLLNIVRSITNEQRPILESHSHVLKLSLPSEPVVIDADMGYIRMALENLISNADKYTPEGGTIKVTLKQTNGEVRLSVEDTGVGIRKKDMSKLFVKFSRIHNPLSIQAGGSGLGLYLAKEIIQLHGGTLRVKSVYGKGTKFTIAFPRV